MKRYDRLSQLNIKKPCSANWDEMTGDEAKRYCGHCRKHVHNLSELPADEAEALLNSGSVCIRYRRDDRGRVITKNALIASAALLAVGCVPELKAEAANNNHITGDVPAVTPMPVREGGVPGPRIEPKTSEEEPIMAMGYVAVPMKMGRVAPPDNRGDAQLKKTTK